MRQLRQVKLPAIVFAAGFAASAWGYFAGARHSEAEQIAQLQETAENYAFLLRNRLELYEGADRALGAFFSASSSIDAEEFDNYIGASRVFERLEGASSFGYLPKVPAADAGRFEAEAARTFPGYRISDQRAGADAWYPLYYAVHGTDPTRAGRLRGADFSSVPERWAAMQEAARRDEPVATAVHPALRHAAHRPVVLIFSPVRSMRTPSAADGQARGGLKGFVFSAMYVDRLFLGFDHGRLASLFDVEVFDGSLAREHLLFDSDGVSHALKADAAQLLAHRAEIPVANRTWLLHFYAKKASLASKAAWAGTTVLAIGLLLTLVASYGVAAWPRYVSRQRAMREFNERFAGFFEHHPFAVYAIDLEQHFIHANQQMARELGVGREALIGAPFEAFVAEEDRGALANHFKDVLAGKTVAYTTRLMRADGRCPDVSIVLVPMSAGSEVTHVLGFAENVTDRKQAEQALHESQQMLQLIIDNIPQSVFWKNLDSVFQGGNRSLLVEMGLDGIDQLVGRKDGDFAAWKDMAEHYRQVDLEVMRSGVGRMRMQATDLRKDGTECWIETSKIPLRDEAGKVVGVLAVTEDITARKYMEQELFRRANYDTLTGLPNRGYFNNQLEEAVKRAQRRGGLALMYFDIDRFKHINDTYGHDVGDQVIRMFAQRVRQVLRESDFIARLGGDEFVLIAEGLHQPGDTAVIGQKMVDAMVPPFSVGGTTLQVSTSIGIAYFEAAMTPETLVKAADQAMYDAKRAGRNCFRQAGTAEQPAEKD
ncbi:MULTISPECIES: diguanylate cyclase domain-containing protein [unclassified Massilia]|uniref:sensor domain-containing diguanylate cyclase n=1 Tax=unclassified Massilia TaxID=2609279 RepID=UPI001B8224EF|nr:MULTISPECIES: diguanylate cyclase [unclassified Massilia]MBQ5940775.1 diguanylate cyclase [Massilia sp. AB1]MBQ5965300.1 diguanylate cyclase [Massilia sp. ZL223]